MISWKSVNPTDILVFQNKVAPSAELAEKIQLCQETKINAEQAKAFFDAGDMQSAVYYLNHALEVRHQKFSPFLEILHVLVPY